MSSMVLLTIHDADTNIPVRLLCPRAHAPSNTRITATLPGFQEMASSRACVSAVGVRGSRRLLPSRLAGRLSLPLQTRWESYSGITLRL